ncbi:MAG TPA: hypothetical protein DDW49_02220 [Deltaproteobacteria bacterium]|nr:MAG: hypothetical protein A2048_06815 [Deltaproteobacteria bacterium GWA2_45_12]HBF12200.1 hypothetical protein [Deltaproteobacteria bacterium]
MMSLRIRFILVFLITIPILFGISWLMADYYFPINDKYRWVALTIALIVIITSLNLYLLNPVCKSIKLLQTAIEQIRNGNFEAITNLWEDVSGPEMKKMAESLRIMAEQLMNIQFNLEEKVAKRTQELKERNEQLIKSRQAALSVVEDVLIEKKKTEQAHEDLRKIKDELDLRVKLRTEELKKSEEKFRLTFQAAPNGLIMVDHTGKIVLMNTQIEKMFLYSQNELAGQSIETLVPQRFHSNHVHYRSQFMQEPQDRQMGAGRDLFGKRKDGTEFPVEIGLKPLVTEEGVFVLSSIIDITERKNAEEKVKKANEDLKRANQLKSSFVSMVSHELRTPLSSMKAGIDMLLAGIDGPVNDEQRETLLIAQKNIDRLARLISNVLDYTRLEAGKMEMDFANINLNELVNEACQSMKHAILEKGLILETILPQTPLFSSCDEDRLKQVILNLLSNAIKFTESGGKIIISLKKTDGILCIEVKDNGIGIDKEDQNRIFEMFNQAITRGIWKTGGSGIGLAVCRLILEQHRGKITVQSQPGNGSTFSITFPQNLSASA